MQQPSPASSGGLSASCCWGLVLYMVGTRTLSEFRIWWARQTGRGSCRFCGRPLTVRVAGLLRIPEGFFGVCAWCGREQPES